MVDDAIRFVSNKSSSSIKPDLEREKHKLDNAVTVDKKRDNSNDIQGPEEEDNKQQQPTTNTVF